MGNPSGTVLFFVTIGIAPLEKFQVPTLWRYMYPEPLPM